MTGLNSRGGGGGGGEEGGQRLYKSSVVREGGLIAATFTLFVLSLRA